MGCVARKIVGVWTGRLSAMERMNYVHASFDDEKHQHQVLLILTAPGWLYQTIFLI